MNVKKRMTGAKPKAHGESESGSDKKNKNNDNVGTNGNRTKFANSADTAAKKFSPHFSDKVAMQLLEKGSVLRVRKMNIISQEKYLASRRSLSVYDKGWVSCTDLHYGLSYAWTNPGETFRDCWGQ